MTQLTNDPAEEGWTKIVTPRRSVWQIPWRDIWAYRDLALLMSKRDVAANYKQTVLGPLWFIMQPLLMTLCVAFIFGTMAHISTDRLPPILFYFSGVVLWNFLSECVGKTAQTFQLNAVIFEKVYFPRLVVPWANSLTALVGLGVQFTCFMAFLIYYWNTTELVHPNWRVIFLPLFVVQLALLGTGLGCIVSALSTRFRDLSLGVNVFVQIWMYASTVLFPLSLIDEDRRWLFLINPTVPVIEAFRFAFLGVGKVEKWHLMLSLSTSTIIFMVGVMLFNRAEQTAMDSV